MKKILLAICVLAVALFFIAGCTKNNETKFKEYYNGEFFVNYPSDFNNISEIRLENQEFGKLTIWSNDFEFDNTTGNIAKGYVIIAFKGYSFDDLDPCNKDYNKWVGTFQPCLLANIDSMAGDYRYGTVTKTNISIKGYPNAESNYQAVKYAFKSTIGKNNNIGLIVKANDQFYDLIIAYRDKPDFELFNKIINSFKIGNKSI